MNAKPIVHIVDDDPAVLHSLHMLLTAEGYEVKTYPCAEDFLKGARPAQASCLVTDVRMPGMSGVELLPKMKELALEMPVIVITAHGDVPLAVQAMKLGAVDLLEKPFQPDALLGAIEQALSRASGREANPKALENMARLATLSGRESEVLKGLLKGHPNKIIAHELGISQRTVEIHRANVMKKTRAGSLAELVRMALNVSSE